VTKVRPITTDELDVNRIPKVTMYSLPTTNAPPPVASYAWLNTANVQSAPSQALNLTQLLTQGKESFSDKFHC
jgi:hypothetical protein